jgi:ABC-type branched-subunit amino acid transport system ATPase component
MPNRLRRFAASKPANGERPSPASAGTGGDSLLEVRTIHRQFGGVVAVDGVSLSLAEGESLGLIGPNGAGKSTVLSVIAGALAPDSGSIAFAGREIAGLPSHKVGAQGIIRTFQVSSEFPRLTVLQNLLVARRGQRGERLIGVLRGRRSWAKEEDAAVDQARSLLRRFNLTELQNEYAGNLSGGQRRLLEVARALMASPRLLLLDEPTAGVHPSMVGELQRQLIRLREDGLAMLMIEHELGIVEGVCQRVIVMARGRVIAEGGLAEVRGMPQVKEAYIAG